MMVVCDGCGEFFAYDVLSDILLGRTTRECEECRDEDAGAALARERGRE